MKYIYIFISLFISTLCNAKEEFGLVAYYSDAFQGRATASEELYDVDKLTAAHRSYPFGTMIKVTRLDNNKSVTVRVNDRGPYVKGHIIDVSKKAAKILGILGTSDIRVKIEAIDKVLVNDNVEAEFPAPAIVMAEKGDMPKKPKKEKAKVKPIIKPKPAKPVKPIEPAKPAAKFIVPDAQLVTSKNFKPFDLYKIQIVRPDRAGYGLQIASMTNYDSVLKQIADLQEDFYQNVLVSLEKEKGKTVYKVILGPFPDMATAESYKSHAKKKKINGFVVSLKSLDRA